MPNVSKEKQKLTFHFPLFCVTVFSEVQKSPLPLLPQEKEEAMVCSNGTNVNIIF